MKIQPFDCGGLEIIAENEWEEAYLASVELNLQDKNFRCANHKTVDFQSYVLVDKDMGDSVL